MNKQNQKGSASIIIIVVLLVAAIAFGAWYVWDNKDKNNNGSNNQDQTQANDQDGSQQQEQQYLTIEEWDVRIPLSPDIEGAYYEFSPQGPGEYVWIYDSGLDSLENVNGVSCGGDNKFPLFAISRITPEALAEVEIETERNNFKPVSFTDEYLFSGVGAHQAPPICAHLDLEATGPVEYDYNILGIAGQKENALREAYKDLQVAN